MNDEKEPGFWQTLRAKAVAGLEAARAASKTAAPSADRPLTAAEKKPERDQRQKLEQPTPANRDAAANVSANTPAEKKFEMTAAQEKRFREITAQFTAANIVGRASCCVGGQTTRHTPCRNLRHCPLRPHDHDYSHGRGGRTHGR